MKATNLILLLTKRCSADLKLKVNLRVGTSSTEVEADPKADVMKYYFKDEINGQVGRKILK